MSESGFTDLRRFLATFPSDQGYEFNEKARRHMRRQLYLSATNGGKYLHELFKDSRYTSGTSSSDENDLKWVSHDHKMRDPSHPNRPCARKFRIGEPTYRCLTCGLDETCALCSDCFRPEHHEGHQLYKSTCQRENGGVCDCGDPEAWIVSLECPHFKSSIIESELDDDFYNSLLETFEIVLDYIIDVMVNSNLMYSKLPQTPSIIKKYSDNSSLLSLKYGLKDINSQKYALILYNDLVRQQQDAIRRIHLATGKVKEYATMISREVEAYGKAVVLISEDLDLLIERQSIMSSTGFNTAIRSLRDIFREDSCDEAIKWIEDITSSTIFEKYEGFRDLVCKAFVKKWDSGVGTDQFMPAIYIPGSLDQFNHIPMIQDSIAKDHPKYWDFHYKQWDLPDELCAEIQYNDESMARDKNEGKSFLGSRIQYLLFMDIRFWKSIRLVLHDLYIYVLISNLKFKQIINCQYVDIYPQVAEMFLTTDREAESSLVCSLSTQLFTCPSNATAIINHGSITRFLAVFYSYITKNVVESPNSVDTSKEINFLNLKNRKWCQLFFDMSYIISRNEQVDLIFGEDVLNQVIDVLLLFQGSPTLKRSPIEHVEYESNDYTIYFHAISILSHFVEGIARCSNKLSNSPAHKMLVENAISLVISRIGEHINSPTQSLDLNRNTRSSSDVDLEPIKYKLTADNRLKIIDFKVSEQSVSFIHSLHAFLSWLIELNKFFKNESQLEPTFMRYFSFDPMSTGSSCYSLQLFDYPLRTLVLLSQIKVGFWVRNGFSVRTQMQIYRKSTIRDGGYSRDLYLTQCFAASLPESVTTATFFDRWELMPWIENNVTSSVYGKDITPLMVEECLLFLINILTDDTHLKQLTGDKVNESRITKEIICALCFKPLSYSELMKEVPDHIASEKKFEYILDIVADLIPPKTFNDVGIYKLKEKYFDEIDPFFVHYTSNKRDEAIEVLKKRIHKKTGTPLDQISLEPNVILFNEENGLYRKIPRITSDQLFTKFLISTLMYITLKGVERNDTLLDLALYLIHICCIYNYEGTFIHQILGIPLNRRESPSEETSIASILYGMLFQEQYKLHHIKIKIILQLVIQKVADSNLPHDLIYDSIQDFNPDALSSTAPDTFMDAATQLEKMKKLANKRKMKILQKFKKQQDQFLANNDTVLVEQSDSEVFDGEMQERDINGLFWSYPEEHCILCQMHKEGEPFGTVGCVSSSPEFRHIPFNDPYWFIKSFSDNENLDHDNIDFKFDNRYSDRWHKFMSLKREELVIGPLFPHRDGLVEDHHIISSCSHGMHYSCFLQYFKDTRKRATQITRKLPEDFDKQEFLCPLCKSLNNCFIPIMAQSNRASLYQYVAPEDDDSTGNKWYMKLQDINKVDFQKLKDSYVADAIISSKDDLIPSYYQALFINPDRERRMHTSIMQSLASSLGLICNLGDVFEKPNIDSILLHTIESVEVSLRGVPHKGYENGIVINQITNQLLTTLRVFSNFRDTVELMNLYTSCKREKKGGDDESSKFISGVEQALGKISLLGNPDDLNDIILSADFFEILLEVEGAKHLDIKTNSILRTCFVSQVLQNTYLLIFKVISNFELLEECISELPIVDSGDNIENAREIFRGIYYHITQNYKLNNTKFETHLSNDVFIARLYSMVIKTTTPFLRKCAIFCYIKCANTKNINFDTFDLDVLECDRLCAFLRVPSIKNVFTEYLHQGSAENIIFTKLVTKLPSLLLPLGSYNISYPGLVSLLELPERLDDFFTKLYYPMNLYHIKNPAICLHCCSILDMQNLSLDSQKGECYQHYKQHCYNDDNGIFLLPKNARLLLIHEDNGSFHDAPYVDTHYELDKEGTHGHVMYLSKERYLNFVRSVWLGHDVSNFITRALENNVDVGGWETL